MYFKESKGKIQFYYFPHIYYLQHSLFVLEDLNFPLIQLPSFLGLISSSFVLWVCCDEFSESLFIWICFCFVSFLKNKLKNLFNLFLKLITYLFLAVLGLCCCTWSFSGCPEPRLLSSCCSQASHCGGFSYCGVVQDARASVVVAHRLSCPAACGIFPDQGSNL